MDNKKITTRLKIKNQYSLVVFQVVIFRDGFDGGYVLRGGVVISEAYGQLLVEVVDEVLHRLEAADLPGEAVVQVGEIVEARVGHHVRVELVQPLVRRRGRLDRKSVV